MPIEKRYPGLKNCNLVVSTKTPESERMNSSEVKRLKIGYWLQRNIPLINYLKPYSGSESAFPKDYETIQPAPWKPEALAHIFREIVEGFY